MNGYIIEMSRPCEGDPSEQDLVYWIGIQASAQAMISALEGHSPSVVDRGPRVLERARAMGLKEGDIRQLPGWVF